MAAIVSGRVLGQDGDPVRGARVFFTGAPVALPDLAELTSGDGSFALGAPAPGEYRLSVHGRGGVAVLELRVASDDITDLEVRLGNAEQQEPPVGRS